MGRPTQQEIDDLKNASKTEDAYYKSFNTTPVPPPMKKPEYQPSPDVGKAPVKKAKGGRIDGIARKGKTRGKVC